MVQHVPFLFSAILSQVLQFMQYRGSVLLPWCVSYFTTCLGLFQILVSRPGSEGISSSFFDVIRPSKDMRHVV